MKVKWRGLNFNWFGLEPDEIDNNLLDLVRKRLFNTTYGYYVIDPYLNNTLGGGGAKNNVLDPNDILSLVGAIESFPGGDLTNIRIDHTLIDHYTKESWDLSGWNTANIAEELRTWALNNFDRLSTNPHNRDMVILLTSGKINDVDYIFPFLLWGSGGNGASLHQMSGAVGWNKFHPDYLLDYGTNGGLSGIEGLVWANGAYSSQVTGDFTLTYKITPSVTGNLIGMGFHRSVPIVGDQPNTCITLEVTGYSVYGITSGMVDLGLAEIGTQDTFVLSRVGSVISVKRNAQEAVVLDNNYSGIIYAYACIPRGSAISDSYL